jgi:hypothetical protein
MARSNGGHPNPDDEQMRKSKSSEKSPSGTWTAGIDVLRQYPYQDQQWHLHAIQFHHEDKDEAERLRDGAFIALSNEPESSAMIDSLNGSVWELGQELETADARIAVLEKALESIAAWGSVSIAGEWEHGLRDIIRANVDVARAALGQKET